MEIMLQIGPGYDLSFDEEVIEYEEDYEERMIVVDNPHARTRTHVEIILHSGRYANDSGAKTQHRH